MSTATASFAESFTDEPQRFVHRWWVSAHPNSDCYDVYVVRYDLLERRNWCLLPHGDWREFPPGREELRPFCTIDGIDLNPKFATAMSWRQIVRQSVTTAVAPALNELLRMKSWLTYQEVAERNKAALSISPEYFGS